MIKWGLGMLFLLWFGMVFLFSNQTGRESSRVSDKVTRDLLEVMEGNSVTQKKVDKWELLVRKFAHFALFASGGALIYLLIQTFGWKNKILISIFLGMLLACGDEYHQLYSQNRGSSFLDVGIDTFGVIFGVLVTFFVVQWIRFFHKKTMYSRSLRYLSQNSKRSFF